MLHQINLLFRRFLTDARQLFRFFVIVNLIPCILLVFTEPYSFMGKVILVTFPLGMYLFVFSWLKNIGLMQLILIPQLIFNAFQIVLFYLFGESVIAVDMFLNLATTNVTEAIFPASRGSDDEFGHRVILSVSVVVDINVRQVSASVFGYKLLACLKVVAEECVENVRSPYRVGLGHADKPPRRGVHRGLPHHVRLVLTESL